MSNGDDDQPLCPGCIQVQEQLIFAHNEMDKAPEPDPFDVIEGMPFLLECALTHLLAGFDFDTQRDSRLGMAVQMLRMAAARAEGLRVQIEQVRRAVESCASQRA